MMRRIVVTGLALILLTIPWSVVAQEEFAQADGLRSSAGRVFVDATSTTYGTLSVVVRIAEFDTEEQTSEVISDWFQQTKDAFEENDYDASNVAPIGIENLADETRLMIGTAVYILDSQYEYPLALLAVRESNFLYTFVVDTSNSDPKEVAIAVASTTLGLDSTGLEPIPGVDYNVGGNWDLLPKIEDVPIGLTWSYDFQPCVGLLASVQCPPEATPIATPE